MFELLGITPGLILFVVGVIMAIGALLAIIVNAVSWKPQKRALDRRMQAKY